MTEDELTLRVLSPDGPSLEVEHLLEVVVPLADGGPIGIRPKHAPLIAETIRGTIQYQTEEKPFEVELLAGILSIRDNIVTILSAGETEGVEITMGPSADPFDQLTEAFQEENGVVEKIK
ncbi:hypothetical protein JR338_02460 [Chloroflexota bacterium]|nr:hypothetical protein JR338_02460 [Chloroflexota bacterium]